MKAWNCVFVAFLAFFVLILAPAGCENPNDPAGPAVINIAAIHGLTAPATGDTPMTAISENAQYGGTVTWAPPVSGVFEAVTQYTAIIYLAPKKGYTLQGVAADFFNIAEAPEGTRASNRANSDVVTLVFPATGPAVISKAAIEGVTVPATGKTPVTKISENAQYSGTVAWNPDHAAFEALTMYTATITLTAKSGYSLQGVAANFFTVSGAFLKSSDANSGVVTAVFSATGSAVISKAAIHGVTPPATGDIPKTVITENEQYIGIVTWSPDHAAFAASTVYTATVTITPKTGFTLTGVASDFFTVAGAETVGNEANSGLVTAVFPITEAAPAVPIDIRSIGGVTAPVAGGIPAAKISENAQYSGTITWVPIVSGAFELAAQYTAIIYLTPKTGYTLQGVPANFFTVSGAPEGAKVSNTANSDVVAVVFPAAPYAVISKAAIEGVIPPATGGTPVTKITENDQYSGTVAWSPAVSGAFAASTIYTATITLTAKSGFTLEGAAANSFTVAGAILKSNDANSGVVKAVFPATGLAVINIAAIQGVTPPATGGTPVTKIIENEQYSGTVAWSPAVSGVFAGSTAYTAEVTLTAKSGFTLAGAAANFFTVAGASAANAANSGIIKAVFPATPPTPPAVITVKAIVGVTVPATGGTPVTTITANDQYTGTITWVPAASGVFAAGKEYTAIIYLTPKTGYTLQGVAANFFTVAGAKTVSNSANYGVVTAEFPATPAPAASVISKAAIEGVTVPATGGTPVTAVTENEQYMGIVSWRPNHLTFAASTTYTATITLTAKTDFTLQGLPANFFTVSGAILTSNDANSGVVTAVFPAIAATVNIAAIKGVTVPAAGGTPASAITENSQYSGTVTWNPDHATFAGSTEYKATIILTVKSGYTLEGVAANFFTVAGASSVSNSANSGVITAVFPATDDLAITIAAIEGVTPPATGRMPVTAVTENEQYNGTVSWSPAVRRTVRIDMYDSSGWGWEGCALRINVNGVDLASNVQVAKAGSYNSPFGQRYTNTYTFTVAEGDAVQVYSVGGFGSEWSFIAYYADTPPSPVFTTSNRGSANWSGSNALVYRLRMNSAGGGTLLGSFTVNTFAAATQYTATITLTPKTGFTLQGVAADFFTAAGAATASNSAESGVITAVFPATAPSVITKAAVGGVYPAVGRPPTAKITENEQYNGTITWNPNHAAFEVSTRYTATIVLTAKSGFTLSGIPANFFTVEGAETVNNSANSGVITAVFPSADKQLPIKMVYVPGGSFEKGKELGTAEPYGGNPPATAMVTLAGFYMGKYEVTQAQYLAVMGVNPSSFNSNPANGEVQGSRPVEMVRWYDAIVFCNRLSIAEGLSPAYRISGSTNPSDWGGIPSRPDIGMAIEWHQAVVVSGSNGYRLPTDAQWEYAAKGGNPLAAGWVGYSYSGSDTPDDVAWYGGNNNGMTHEVGKKQPNKLGIYDMSGNVWEWCWDRRGEGDYQVGGDYYRYYRGGSYKYSLFNSRIAYSYTTSPSDQDSSIGFRLVRP